MLCPLIVTRGLDLFVGQYFPVVLLLVELFGVLLGLDILGVSAFGSVGVLLLPSLCYFIYFI